MKTLYTLIIVAVLVLVPLTTTQAEELCSPGFTATQVDKTGALQEPWGKVCLRLEGVRTIKRTYSKAPMPVVTVTEKSGAVTLTQSAFRSPIWPRGIDVLDAEIENTGSKAAEVVLEVKVDREVSFGDKFATQNGRNVMSLPQGFEPVRDEKSWGCTGGCRAYPGWANPKSKCDPAYRNIRVGESAPIIYRFAVPVGSKRAVVLGLCEGHWQTAGKRPLEIYVEGAPKMVVDPVAQWGRNVPGALRFDACDKNKDGRLQVVVAPSSGASDENTILNAIWVFSTDTYFDTKDVVTGSMTPAAEYFVDVGGKKDQMLYNGRECMYKITLAPGAKQQMLFLLKPKGGNEPPDQETMAWTRQSLSKAARDVWRDGSDDMK
jgi:hypothetical protein